MSARLWAGIVTLFPDLVTGSAAAGVLGRAVEQGIIDLDVFNPRDFARDRHRTVDDRPYGGGPGMVMQVEPLQAALQAAKDAATRRGLDVPVIYLSPQG
ncbi:MAG: tRNA (guanosine(37)-N1)-methyltransferase TrmD, partial [Pseudomonadales bacterium]|nr:tRNA (guanosine(37)-N1)-methyltransferase TrmD [Pseudomonadales bacterium]